MAHIIIKLQNLYCEWSTIVDAPVSYMMNAEEMTACIRERYGTEGARSSVLANLEDHGTSCGLPWTPARIIAYNRAGENGSELDEAGIIARYTRPNAEAAPAAVDGGSASRALLANQDRSNHV